MKKGRDSERIFNTYKYSCISNSIYSALGRFGELHDLVLEQAEFFLGTYHLKSTGEKTEV